MNEASAAQRLRNVPGLFVVKIDATALTMGIPDYAYVVRRERRTGMLELKYGRWPCDTLGHGLTRYQAAWLTRWRANGGNARVLLMHERGCVIWDRAFVGLIDRARDVEPCYAGACDKAILRSL